MPKTQYQIFVSSYCFTTGVVVFAGCMGCLVVPPPPSFEVGDSPSSELEDMHAIRQKAAAVALPGCLIAVMGVRITHPGCSSTLGRKCSCAVGNCVIESATGCICWLPTRKSKMGVSSTTNICVRLSVVVCGVPRRMVTHRPRMSTSSWAWTSGSEEVLRVILDDLSGRPSRLAVDRVITLTSVQ